MEPIREQSQIDHYLALVLEMTTEESREQFNSEWIRKHAWKVVPVEDTMHFADVEIGQIVSALNRYGFTECLAVATQKIEILPTCFHLSLTVSDLRKFNSECGPFRYLLTSSDRKWAISCHEWYNLFAGPPTLIEAMLGEPIEQAEREFREYALILAGGLNPDESILEVAKHYAAL